MTSAVEGFRRFVSRGAAIFDHDITRSTVAWLPRPVHLEVAHHQDLLVRPFWMKRKGSGAKKPVG